MAQKTTAIGRYAEASIGGVVIAQLYDWEVSIEADYEDVTAHGDEWEVVVPLKQRWTFRARQYCLLNVATSLTAFTTSAEPAGMTVRCYTEPAATGSIVFQAGGFPTRALLSAPMELVQQEIEIRGTSTPTTIG